MDTDSIDYSARAKFWKSMANFNLDMLAKLRREHETFRVALESIAKNTCCDRCQEAALVAQAALTKGRRAP